ncbi:MAG: hypothetical protein E7622_05820 [Ruminococcaceae bacterium]|nr:hypothetical protein [Oscillospiraceae bacterium]
MQKRKLFSYTIVYPDLEHLEEICQDIKAQVDAGVADCPLFELTLVPEGNPPVDKARIMCEKYAPFKARLDELGIESGILIQATVGHGWILGEMFPYQTHVNFTDGVATRVCCPFDEGFREYIFNAMKTVASYGPCHIMIDDDLRTIWYKGEGCACPLHMAEFNKNAGTDLSREELWNIVHERTEQSKKYTDIFIEAQKKSLVEVARIIRRGIDSVNPKIPASYCCCGNNAEFAYEIASELAGEENPVTVRINNGNYTPTGARNFSRVFQRIATQVSKLKDKVDVILAETDTCPQNRYSTGAMSLHTHYTGSILEGACGAKHWITRLITHEPKSGIAYRKILAKNRGFYEKLSELYPKLEWLGCRIHTPSEPNFTYGRVKEEWDAWSLCVLERLGLPMYFSSKNGGVVCLEGDVDTVLSNDDIKAILSGNVIMASDTAHNLIKRGFGAQIGVDVREWTGKQPVREIFSDGAITALQMKIKELVPLSDEVLCDSYVCNTLDNEIYERLFPGLTVYENDLGGTVAVFAGTPACEFNISQAFSFLNYSRKQQLIKLLGSMGALPAYYPNDEEVYLKVAKNGDELLLAVFNIGLDPIDKLEMVFEKTPTSIERLCPNGQREAVSFEIQEGRIVMDIPCNTLDPVIIFVKNKEN